MDNPWIINEKTESTVQYMGSSKHIKTLSPAKANFGAGTVSDLAMLVLDPAVLVLDPVMLVLPPEDFFSGCMAQMLLHLPSNVRPPATLLPNDRCLLTLEVAHVLI